jgi:hypothetical protein
MRCRKDGGDTLVLSEIHSLHGDGKERFCSSQLQAVLVNAAIALHNRAGHRLNLQNNRATFNYLSSTMYMNMPTATRGFFLILERVH